MSNPLPSKTTGCHSQTLYSTGTAAALPAALSFWFIGVTPLGRFHSVTVFQISDRNDFQLEFFSYTVRLYTTSAARQRVRVSPVLSWAGSSQTPHAATRLACNVRPNVHRGGWGHARGHLWLSAVSQSRTAYSRLDRRPLSSRATDSQTPRALAAILRGSRFVAAFRDSVSENNPTVICRRTTTCFTSHAAYMPKRSKAV